jgi:FAD/FMN-containing dehydrogenase
MSLDRLSRTAWLVVACLIGACTTSSRSEQSGVGAALSGPDASSVADTNTLADAGTSATDLPLSAAVEALLQYQRPTLPALECPGLFISGSCGDGSCDDPAETADNCPADCVFHLAGAYNDLPICPSFMDVAEPTDTEGVQQAVRTAVAQGKRIRVLGASHSASQLICGDGLALRMSQFADVSKSEVRGDVVYVQPGVRMIDLGDWLYARNLSIGYTHIGYRGITVAGGIGTAAHGSSPRHGSALSQRLESVRVVLADGTLHSYDRSSTPDALIRAFDSHLGLLGVITEVGIRVEPAFNLDTRIDGIDEAALLTAASPLELIEGCDFAAINWFPGQHKALRWCGERSAEPAVRADNTLLDPGVSPSLAPIAKLGFHSGTCSDDINALLEEVRFQGLVDEPPIAVTAADGSITHTDHAVGPAHRMMSADLIALDDNKYFQMDWEVVVPEKHMQEALHIARQVFDAHNVHLPGVGVFLRFTKVERGGYLTYHGAGGPFVEGERAMFFETPVAVPVGYSEAQLREYLYVYEQLASLFIRYFGARAHWGKNLDALFDLQRGLGTYAERLDGMNQAVAELDPYGVFSNAFAERIGIRWPKRDADFASALGGDTCSCSGVAEPVCDAGARITHANACRAACSGAPAAQLVPGPCAALEWGECSAFEAGMCVWRKQGAAADRTRAPELRL